MLEELAEVGYGALTIEGVARRAGVGKSTVYRHWEDRVDLIAEALEHAHIGMVPPPGSGPARDNVVSLVRHVVEVVDDPLYGRCIPALIEGAQRDDRVSSFHYGFAAARREELASMIAQGIEEGELASPLDADLAAVTLLGVIFYRRLMTRSRMTPADAESIVDALLPVRARR
ncbi:MAG: TetR/AcrR family transcriptional regulator [Acidimicrobiales bacterium]